MMAIGIGAVVFMWSAGSVMTEVISSEPWRRLATGVLFAGGGTAVVLSPLGQRSGGHLNPAMTLAFWLRGKITHTDAATVNPGMTTPGLGYSATVALAAELVITFSLTFLVFWAVDRRFVAPFTPYLAGVLIAFFSDDRGAHFRHEFESCA